MKCKNFLKAVKTNWMTFFMELRNLLHGTENVLKKIGDYVKNYINVPNILPNANCFLLNVCLFYR